MFTGCSDECLKILIKNQNQNQNQKTKTSYQISPIIQQPINPSENKTINLSIKEKNEKLLANSIKKKIQSNKQLQKEIDDHSIEINEDPVNNNEDSIEINEDPVKNNEDSIEINEDLVNNNEKLVKEPLKNIEPNENPIKKSVLNISEDFIDKKIESIKIEDGDTPKSWFNISVLSNYFNT